MGEGWSVSRHPLAPCLFKALLSLLNLAGFHSIFQTSVLLGQPSARGPRDGQQTLLKTSAYHWQAQAERWERGHKAGKRRFLTNRARKVMKVRLGGERHNLTN